MSSFKSHFAFSKSQQNGIFLLVIIIISLQLGYYFYPFSAETAIEAEEQEVVERLQRKVDSLKQLAAEKQNEPPAPFNPNYISDFKGYMLGLSVEEIDRLHEYRAQEKWINSAEDFQKVTAVSDSLLQVLGPAFQFPVFGVQKNYEERNFSEAIEKKDLNSATAEELQVINGIGEKLSERIVNYRKSLGGFRAASQLKDVYGLSPEVVERLFKRFEVFEEHHEKQDLNEIEVLALSELPYFNYELARAVVNFRRSRGSLESFEELEAVKDFPFDKLDRIKLYLTID